MIGIGRQTHNTQQEFETMHGKWVKLWMSSGM